MLTSLQVIEKIKHYGFSFSLIIALSLWTNYNLEAKQKEKKFYDNEIYIRVQRGFYDRNQVQTMLDKNHLVVSQLLLPSQSLFFNQDLQFLINQNQNRNEILKTEEPLLRTFRLKFNENIDPQEFCSIALKKYPFIEIAEPIAIHKITGQFIPNDVLAASQGMFNQIKAFDAWNLYKGDSNIVIGISDNGENQTHEDLKPNIAINKNDPVNGIDDDHNGYIDDYNGYNFSAIEDDEPFNSTVYGHYHGTVVSGIAAARFNNKLDLCGTGANSKFFPIKCGKQSEVGSGSISYSMESLIFAALRGFKVVNCSWGSANFYSQTEQNVVDYCVAKDLVICAAAGNTPGPVTISKNFYPAGYFGVLGVGSVDNTDYAGNYIGKHCRIMAPGGGQSYILLNSSKGTEIEPGNWTSYATPVVSGAIALARGKNPSLNALQSIEFVRQCVDNIDTLQNILYRKLVPGRLNLLKVVNTNPMSIPAILPQSINYAFSNGNITQRFSILNDYFIKIQAKNILGAATNVKFKLSMASPYSNVWGLRLENDSIFMPSISPNQTISLDSFKFYYTIANADPKVIFRVDITADGGYHDFFLFDFYPIIDVTTFENDAIKFSVSDDANLGFDNNTDSELGVGFILKGYGNAIYSANLIDMYNDDINTAIFSFQQDQFKNSRPYFNPDTFAVWNGGNRTFIMQNIFVPNGNKPFARIRILFRNNNVGSISNPEIGYKFDWDVGIGGGEHTKNVTQLLQEARGDVWKNQRAAVQIAESIKDSAVFGSGIFSEEPNAVAQAANNVTGTFDTTTFASGVSIQSKDTTDINYFMGMRYNGVINSQEERVCYMCIAAARNRKEFISAMQECMFKPGSVEDSFNQPNLFSLKNEIITDNLTIIMNHEYAEPNLTIKIVDILGNIISNSKLQAGLEINADCSNLQSGTYFISIETNSHVSQKKFLVIK